MSDRPTPDTDDEAISMDMYCDDTSATVYIKRGGWVVYGDFVLGDFARKLERERDEAREQAAMWKANHDNQVSLKAMLMDRPDLGDRSSRIAELIRERDEARERIERQKLEINRLNGATNHAGGTPLKIALRERDEAREAFVITTDQMVQAQCKTREALRERDEVMAEIQRLRLDAQREAEQHDRMVKELEGLYDQLAKTKSSNEHICSLSKDLMGNCIICDG